MDLLEPLDAAKILREAGHAEAAEFIQGVADVESEVLG